MAASTPTRMLQVVDGDGVFAYVYVLFLFALF